jgi:hypothetical protein
MFRRIGRCVIALALCCSLGGYWLTLQSIAWATMVFNYSQHCSFKQAIVQTFDGKHPCDLCKHISKTRNGENKQDRQPSSAKTDLICTIHRVLLLPPFAPFDYFTVVSSSVDALQEPLSPPPRGEVA